MAWKALSGRMCNIFPAIQPPDWHAYGNSFTNLPPMKLQRIPPYMKMTLVLTGLIAVSWILYIGKDILVPLVFALLLAILLDPVVSWLTGRTVHRILAILLAVATAFLLATAIVYFLLDQLGLFFNALPQLREKFNALFNEAIVWLSGAFQVSAANIHHWLDEQKAAGLSNIAGFIGRTLTTVTGLFTLLFLLPVYAFLFLLYKPMLRQFITMLFSSRSDNKRAGEILSETKGLVQQYLVGLLAEMALVAILNAGLLLLLGIDYAILIGILCAFLNIIPYIGGIVAAAIPMVIALLTKDPIYILWVLIAHLVVQFIDNNLIVPRIVASRVKINALFSIIAVVVGGAFWGIPGMILSLPLTAVIKVACDRIEALKPYGFLLGENPIPNGNKKPSKKSDGGS
jgi:predicted PurR-regulated permease PerM